MSSPPISCGLLAGIAGAADGSMAVENHVAMVSEMLFTKLNNGCLASSA
jgi:hypothetical protein